MKTIFKVFGLEETRFVSDVTLGSNGIHVADSMIVVRKHVADCKSESDAFSTINNCDIFFEHGFEIVRVTIKE